MALKGDRIELNDGSRIKYFMTTATTPGRIVNFNAPGGAGMDSPDATLAVPAGPSGNPAGVLMCEVVNYNLTRTHINEQQDQVQVGNKVPLLTRGVVRTNCLKSGDTPEAGEPAHYTVSGEFTTTTTSDQVGVFAGPPDAEGYVEVEVNIQ